MDTLFPYTTLFRSLGSRMVSDLPIREALDRVGTYPPQLRRRLLPLFMEAALRERRHAESLKAAAALANIATTPGEAAAAAFVEGPIAHREGRSNEAVKRFEQSAARSEERRVGNECGRTCRHRLSPSHSKKKNDI